jgi:serine/threonine-protein kinase RIO1
MTMHHFLRLSFIALFVITAFICLYFIIKKQRNKKGPKLLSKEEYSPSMLEKMTEITVSDKEIFNIWPYISKLKAAKILSHKIKESQLVHKVYRNSTEDFEHILLSTEKENHFVVIVANRNKKKTVGYFLHDLNGLYA